MTWIFDSFLVTLRTLTSCLAVMSKQGYDSTSGQSGKNRRVTGRRPRDENHVVRFRPMKSIGVEPETRSRSEASQRPLWRYGLNRGASVDTPWLPGKKYGTRGPRFWVYVSPFISQQTKNCGSFSRIKWGIYFYQGVFRSFIEFRIIIMAIHHSYTVICSRLQCKIIQQDCHWIAKAFCESPMKDSRIFFKDWKQTMTV